MAGHRRRTGEPLLAEKRVRNRRSAAAARIAAARTPGERLGAAADEVRSALTLVPPARADQVAGSVVEHLVSTASHLYAEVNDEATRKGRRQ